MTGRHPRAIRSRDERGHPVVKHAIEQGHLESGEFYWVRGFATWESADEGRKSIYNAARHLDVSLSSRAQSDILPDPEGGYMLRFRVFAKIEGRRHVIAATGGDPGRLAYNPFTRGEGPPAAQTVSRNPD